MVISLLTFALNAPWSPLVVCLHVGRRLLSAWRRTKCATWVFKPDTWCRSLSHCPCFSIGATSVRTSPGPYFSRWDVFYAGGGEAQPAFSIEICIQAGGLPLRVWIDNLTSHLAEFAIISWLPFLSYSRLTQLAPGVPAWRWSRLGRWPLGSGGGVIATDDYSTQRSSSLGDHGPIIKLIPRGWALPKNW